MTSDDLTLEERARQAAAGVIEAVDGADLQLFSAGLPALRERATAPRKFRGPDRWVVAAGAFVAVIVIVGLALLPGRLFSPDNDVLTTEPTRSELVATTIGVDSPNEPTVTTAGVADTTTSTSEAQTSTTPVIDAQPPDLTITSPSDGATVITGTVQFRGTTEPGARVIAAGRWEADVDENGEWEIILGVVSGSNIATFTAIDAAGNETTAQVTIIYDPPSPTTTTSTTLPIEDPGEGEGTAGGQSVAFTASAVFEICTENPPYNVYWGTAPAGHKVTIGSEYGQGHVFADEAGNWEIRVEFPEAPNGVEFAVTVRHTESGDTRSFGCTSLLEG